MYSRDTGRGNSRGGGGLPAPCEGGAGGPAPRSCSRRCARLFGSHAALHLSACGKNTTVHGLDDRRRPFRDRRIKSSYKSRAQTAGTRLRGRRRPPAPAARAGRRLRTRATPAWGPRRHAAAGSGARAAADLVACVARVGVLGAQARRVDPRGALEESLGARPLLPARALAREVAEADRDLGQAYIWRQRSNTRRSTRVQSKLMI